MRRFVIAALLACAVGLVSSVVWAEMRTWKAAEGGFTTEAEYVGLKDANTVTLRLKSGANKDIALDKLCETDRAYVRERFSGPADPKTKLGSAAKPESTLASSEPATENTSDAGRRKPAGKGAADALSKEVQTCENAVEALALYRAFVEDPAVPAEERESARSKVAQWESAAGKNLVRMGRDWVTPEAAKAGREKSLDLVRQGFELLRLNQERLAYERLLEASKSDPNSIKADFAIGLVYAISERNYIKARDHFEICNRRSPGNVAVLNNLALMEIKCGNSQQAALRWKAAIKLSKDQRIAQNIGRLIDLAGKNLLRPPVPRTTVVEMTRIYSDLLTSGVVGGASKTAGWQYILIPLDLQRRSSSSDSEPTGTELAKAGELASDEKVPTDERPLEATVSAVGYGTGFVVAPNYVLTNRHVVEDGFAFQVADPDPASKRRHVAKLHALCDTDDLALLHVPTLEASPVPLQGEVPRRGTDIMLIGFPEPGVIGTTIKATRGSIVALPNKQVGGLMLYDATSNPGNSGSPVCSNQAAVVGVHSTGFNTASRYAGGIPMERALPFLSAKITNFEPLAGAGEPMEWPQVDDRISRSTVMIIAGAPAAKLGLEKKSTESYLEDRSCALCDGAGKVDCPVRDCTKGTVGAMQTQVVGVNPATGGNVTESVRVRVRCNNCRGEGNVRCPRCGGVLKVDPDLNRGK